jgi:hypothetical protein
VRVGRGDALKMWSRTCAPEKMVSALMACCGAEIPPMCALKECGSRTTKISASAPSSAKAASSSEAAVPCGKGCRELAACHGGTSFIGQCSVRSVMAFSTNQYPRISPKLISPSPAMSSVRTGSGTRRPATYATLYPNRAFPRHARSRKRHHDLNLHLLLSG